MNILCLDTCFDACSVAVQRRDGRCISERQLMRRGHAEALVPMIQHTMSKAAISFDALDRIAVTTGPGTFTGARVGVSAALGIALAHNLDIVTYSSLTCIARAAQEFLGTSDDNCNSVIVARDARRDSVYWQVSTPSTTAPDQPALLSLKEARHTLVTLQASSERLIGIGSGIELLDVGNTIVPLATALPANLQPGNALPEGIEEPDARFMLIDASHRKPDPNPAPLYLRAPDAKPSSTPPLPRRNDRRQPDERPVHD